VQQVLELLWGFSMTFAATSERERHLSFLRAEFEGNDFFQTDDFGLNDLLLQELVDTIFAPSFEGRRPGHGAVICSHKFDEYQGSLPAGTWLSSLPNEGRIYCDGIKTFRMICRDAQGVFAFSDSFIFDELDLFTLRDDSLFNKGGEEHGSPLKKDMFLIKRSENGEIILLCREGIAVHRDARLSFFRYQYHFKSLLLDHLNSSGRPIPWHKQVLDSILRISIHVLGADAGVGGTIVLLHPDDEALLKTVINGSNALEMPRDLKITLRDHQSLLITAMRHTDGAVVVDSEGYVRSAKNWLVVPSEEMAKAGSEGGTRHLTARLFSGLIQGLVFVISSDGPVTLYSGGEPVFRTCDRR